MVKIATFMLCDSLEHLSPPSPIMKLVNPIYLLRPKYIPGTLSFSIAFGIDEIPDMPAHNIQISITSPKGSEIYNTQPIVIQVPNIDKELPQDYQGFMFAIDIRNLELPCAGEYICNISIDETPAEPIKFGVFKAPKMPQ